VTEFFDETAGILTIRRTGLLMRPGVVHAFTTRRSGFGEGPCSGLNLDFGKDIPPGSVYRNHFLLAAALGYSPFKAVRTRQVHGDSVREAKPEDSGLREHTAYECDALITDRPGVPLLVFSADCIPVLLYDPEKGAAAAIHSGWRGTAAGIAAKAVRAMRGRYGTFPGNLLAAIGPGIGPCCFETGEEVVRAIGALGFDVSGFIRKVPGEKWYVDLKGIIARTLEEEGLAGGNICADPECSRCLPSKYWSHRRSGQSRGVQAAVIMLK